MKALLTLLVTAFTVISAQADEGRVLMNASTSLKENECVFRQSNIREKKIAALLEYDYIINSCDAKPTSALIIWADHMKQGYCAYDLVQKMSGYTLARVMKPCSTQQVEPEFRVDTFNDEEIMAMPPALEEVQAQPKPKPKAPVVVKKAIPKKVAPEEKQQNAKAEKDNEDTPEIKNYIPPAVDQDF